MNTLFKAVLLIGLFSVACGDEDKNTDDSDPKDNSQTDNNGQATDTDDTGQPTDTDNSDDTSDDGANANCDTSYTGADESLFDETNNRFNAKLWDFEGVVEGEIFDGREPIYQEESDRIGVCRLLTYNGAPCDNPCDWPDLCVDGACQPSPLRIPVGPVSIETSKGLSGTIEPNETSRYNWYEESFKAGEEEWVSIEIPELGDGVSLTACITNPLNPTEDFTALFDTRADGADVTVKWSNPVPYARVYLHMTTCIGTHGGISPVEIECEGPDTGALTIPGSFLDAISTCAGCWGRGECGYHKLLRYHAVQTVADGKEIQLRSTIESAFGFYPGRNLSSGME